MYTSIQAAALVNIAAVVVPLNFPHSGLQTYIHWTMTAVIAIVKKHLNKFASTFFLCERMQGLLNYVEYSSTVPCTPAYSRLHMLKLHPLHSAFLSLAVVFFFTTTTLSTCSLVFTKLSCLLILFHKCTMVPVQFNSFIFAPLPWSTAPDKNNIF